MIPPSTPTATSSSELVSNASDALDKLRFEALTDENLAHLAEDLHILIEADPGARTLTVSDNGIGMTRSELVDFIGTIARSGTREYLELLQGKGAGSFPEELIGQFGIGFYSSFMVADRVSLVTRRAGESAAWKWDSAGDGNYTLEETSRDAQGTSVTLRLKKDEEDETARDYSDPPVIGEIIRRYSDFVAWPIRMKSADGSLETLNSMKALWTRPEEEVTAEEYDEFYRHITHDWNKPLRRVLFKAEGGMEFRALLYIPPRAPLELFTRDLFKGVQLYIRRVFIMDDCRELVPEYLRFLRGLVGLRGPAPQHLQGDAPAEPAGGDHEEEHRQEGPRLPLGDAEGGQGCLPRLLGELREGPQGGDLLRREEPRQDPRGLPFRHDRARRPCDPRRVPG